VSEQLDIAVALGVVPPPLPDISFFEDIAANPPQTPSQIIEGIPHHGCKMILRVRKGQPSGSACLSAVAISVRLRGKKKTADVEDVLH
jgi:hypothetical protein